MNTEYWLKYDLNMPQTSFIQTDFVVLHGNESYKTKPLALHTCTCLRVLHFIKPKQPYNIDCPQVYNNNIKCKITLHCFRY